MASRVAVIYNEPKPSSPEEHWLSRSANDLTLDTNTFRDASEYGVVEQMESIAEALETDGHTVLCFSANDDVLRLNSFLKAEQPEAIFNCCESILGKASLEMNVAGLYELFGIEYTGSPALTLGIALNKDLSKQLFKANNIPTPAFYLVREKEELTSLPALEYPLIVKPVREDASIGIDSNAIVRNFNDLRDRVHFVLKEFKQPALIEEFIDGRELNVGVIGQTQSLEALPISEITFDKLPEGSPRIVSYEAKWVEESPLYKATLPICPAILDASIEEEAKKIALEAAKTIGIRDYGRVDLRLRESDNKLFVLEANPNPDISEDAGFMRAAIASGRNYAGTINEIMHFAIERSKQLRSK